MAIKIIFLLPYISGKKIDLWCELAMYKLFKINISGLLKIRLFQSTRKRRTERAEHSYIGSDI